MSGLLIIKFHASNINLSASHDRRVNIEAQLAEIGYQDHISRFPEIDGATSGPFDNIGKNGVWACRRSHEEVISRALEESATVVFEDDVQISRHFPDVVNESLMGQFVQNSPETDMLIFYCCPFYA